MKHWASFAPLIVLGVLVLVSAFLLLRGGERELFTVGLVGQPAPAYALEQLGGGDLITGEERRGRAYVINMFASWCTPCRAEHPELVKLQQQGVEIVGVAYKDRPENTARFLNQLGNPFSAVALDPDGRFGLEMGVAGVPETFVIGPDGVVRAAHRGALTARDVREVIEPALR
ncbi:MAG TPA: DsbE family thiol:disulfide interchange protein [Terricaulis sp.]|nr:DsbE family thiol:disulfide interchange protein [Terricaulis sp.]